MSWRRRTTGEVRIRDTTSVYGDERFRNGFWYGLSAGLGLSGLVIMLYVLATGSKFCE